MKKRVLAGMLAVMMACTVISCSKEDQTEEKGSAAVSETEESCKFRPSDKLDPNYACTIDVIGAWGNFEALDQAALDFKEFYPNIEVVYSSLSDPNMDIKNRMASGEGIDLYLFNWLNVNNASSSFIWKNAADLTQLGLELDEVDPDMLQTGYIDGMLKMMPIYRRMYGFMVNEDLLKEHGLEVPKTYEEFLNCCETFHEAGMASVLLQGNLNFALTYNQHIVAKTMQHKERGKIMEDALKGKDSFGVVEETLQMMEELTEKGYVHPDSNQLEDDYEAVILRFFEGDIPFVPYNTEQFSGTRKREAKSENFTAHPFTYQFIPFPGETGYEAVFEQLGTTYMGIFDGVEDEKKQYVGELLRYLLSDEGNTTLGQIKNMPSTNIHTGFSGFPYYEALKDDQIYVVGENGFSLAYSEVLTEAHVNYEAGMTAEEYLKKSLDFIAGKRKQ